MAGEILFTYMEGVFRLHYKDNNVLSFAFIIFLVFTVPLAGLVFFLKTIQCIRSCGKDEKESQTPEKPKYSLIGCSFVLYIALSFSLGVQIVFLFVMSTFGRWFIGGPLLFLFWMCCLLLMNRQRSRKRSLQSSTSYDNINTFNDELDGLLGRHEITPKKRLLNILNHIRDFFHSISYGLNKRRVTVLLISLFLCLFSMGISLISCNTCVEYFPHALTTSFTRVVLGQGRICGWNKICHSYLTVPEDISNSMIVNFNFFGAEPVLAIVLLSDSPIHVEGNSTADVYVFQADCFHMEENLDETRYQCWSDLFDLSPSSTYYALPVVYVYNAKTNATYTLGDEIKFRTGPEEGDKTPIKFVTGGDMMMLEAGISLSRFAATQEPLFAVLGGDIAYANGDPNCYRRWDQWFADWKRYMTTPTNYSVPILATIGNHEAGGFMMKKYQIGSYLRYFPHELGLADISPQDRPLNHSHVFGGHSVLLALDSWVHTQPSDQVPFIKETLTKYQDYHNRMVVYHAAMYPSKLNLHRDEAKVVKEINNVWRPVFDEYNVTHAFENHFHLYKITYPIYDGKLANFTAGKSGTVYIGDGAWGLTSGSYEKNTDPLIKSIENKAHVHVVTLTPHHVHVDSYGYEELIAKVVKINP